LAPLAGELAVDAQRVAELVAPAGGRLVLPPPPRRRRPRPPPAPRRAPRPPPRRRTTRRRRRTRRGPRRAGRRAATGDDGGSWCAPPSDGRRRLPFSGAELSAPLLDAPRVSETRAWLPPIPPRSRCSIRSPWRPDSLLVWRV